MQRARGCPGPRPEAGKTDKLEWRAAGQLRIDILDNPRAAQRCVQMPRCVNYAPSSTGLVFIKHVRLRTTATLWLWAVARYPRSVLICLRSIELTNQLLALELRFEVKRIIILCSAKRSNRTVFTANRSKSKFFSFLTILYAIYKIIHKIVFYIL